MNVIEAATLGQAVLGHLGAAGLHAGDPGGPGGRPRRAERGGQDHADADGRRPDHPDRGPGDGARRASPPGRAEALKRVAFVAQDVPLYRHLPVGDMVRLARGPERRPLG